MPGAIEGEPAEVEAADGLARDGGVEALTLQRHEIAQRRAQIGREGADQGPVAGFEFCRRARDHQPGVHPAGFHDPHGQHGGHAARDQDVPVVGVMRRLARSQPFVQRIGPALDQPVIGQRVELVEVLVIELLHQRRGGRPRIQVKHRIERLAGRAKGQGGIVRAGRDPQLIEKRGPERILEGAVEQSRQQIQKRLGGQHGRLPPPKWEVCRNGFYDKRARTNKRRPHAGERSLRHGLPRRPGR